MVWYGMVLVIIFEQNFSILPLNNLQMRQLLQSNKNLYAADLQLNYLFVEPISCQVDPHCTKFSSGAQNLEV